MVYSWPGKRNGNMPLVRIFMQNSHGYRTLYGHLPLKDGERVENISVDDIAERGLRDARVVGDYVQLEVKGEHRDVLRRSRILRKVSFNGGQIYDVQELDREEFERYLGQSFAERMWRRLFGEEISI